MKEIKSIIKQYSQAINLGKKTALATVVHLEGSSYRRPGARMLIEDDGHLTGAISGGCLEGDALRKSLHVIGQNRAMLVTYDTMDDDDAKFGVGLGCNGIIQVLIEPIDPDDPLNPIELLKVIISKRQESVLITLFDLADRHLYQPGTCMIYRSEQLAQGHLDYLPSGTEADIKTVLEDKKSAFKEYVSATTTITAFIEYMELPVALMIIGGGNDAYPLVDIANTIGWEPHVIDGRANYATQDRFASACSIIVAKPEKVLEQIHIDHRTVFVLMTHNYHYDLAMLRALLQIETPYIGSLGPKKKLDRMMVDLEKEGIKPTRDQLEKIFGPTGLDIGAETPEEIAVSIIAEVQAVLSQRNPQFLRDAGEYIHSRAALKIIPSGWTPTLQNEGK